MHPYFIGYTLHQPYARVLLIENIEGKNINNWFKGIHSKAMEMKLPYNIGDFMILICHSRSQQDQCVYP
jgi:hypothetical protein